MMDSPHTDPPTPASGSAEHPIVLGPHGRCDCRIGLWTHLPDFLTWGTLA
jgi:hypothetical protein